MTLNYCKVTFFYRNSHDFAILVGNNGYTNEDSPIVSETKLWRTKYTFHQCIDYVDIVRRSSARRRQTKVGWGNKPFSRLHVNISKTVGHTSEDTIND